MSDVTEALEDELVYEWNELRKPDEWVPAFVDVGGYKSLDIEVLREDMDARAWGYYRAGLIEAYGKALRQLEKQNDE